MNNPREQAALDYARAELEVDGVISLTTAMDLMGLGFDVPALEQSFEEEIENG